MPPDPTSASTFRLTVLDAETSLRLEGVSVTASNLGDRLGESFTDGSGACEVPRPTTAPQDFYFRPSARLDGYATMEACGHQTGLSSGCADASARRRGDGFSVQSYSRRALDAASIPEAGANRPRHSGED